MPSNLTPADTILSIDVGNSRIGLGLWDDDGLHAIRHLDNDKPGAWESTLAEIWAATVPSKNRAIVIASVSPPISRQFADLILRKCEIEPFFVRDDLPLPLTLDIENPREVGVDRICSAAAAYDRVREPCTIASFGTATTIDCVSGDGRFLGGAILPGLDISCEILHTRTAKLPHVAPRCPKTSSPKTPTTPSSTASSTPPSADCARSSNASPPN
jgi:type III pantothenate kinase